jgi:hypothetical protein
MGCGYAGFTSSTAFLLYNLLEEEVEEYKSTHIFDMHWTRGWKKKTKVLRVMSMMLESLRKECRPYCVRQWKVSSKEW